MLKYGSNLLQVVGHICLYVLRGVNSFSHIKTPVKGHTCKHLRCFDFNNYVGINSRRPQWRCPHCSQSVSFHDIRIDQSMVKVLKEVGEDITYVKFSGDGTWEPAVTENNEHTEKRNENPPPVHQECTINNVHDIMDLTEGDNETDTRDKDFEKKPTSNDMNNVQRNTAPHMEDGFWREFYSSLPTRTSDVAPLGRETSFQRNHNLVLNSMGQNQSQNENLNNIGNGPKKVVTVIIQKTPKDRKSSLVIDIRYSYNQENDDYEELPAREANTVYRYSYKTFSV